MKQWAGKSLLERVALFKRRFPYTHITVYKIRKLYRFMKIKKKLVRVGKTVPSRTVNLAAVEAINLADDCRSATLNSFRIVQLDEMIVSKTCFPKFDWALKLKNTTESGIR